MKVTIVTISYNQARFLEQTLLSVLDQDYPDIEYIVVDPGSADGSRELIQKYQDRIARIIFEPDQGPAQGLNKGFKFATGEIFGFLNSDDVLLPGAVSTIVKYFKDHPEIDVVSGNAKVIDQDNREIRKVFSDRFILKGVPYGYLHLIQPSTFFRNAAFKKVSGFNEKNNVAWDEELYVNMKLAGMKFDRIDKELSAFRIHPASISGLSLLGKNRDEYYQRIFVKVMYRDRAWFDRIIGIGTWIYHCVSNPRSVYNRIIKGRYFGRYKS